MGRDLILAGLGKTRAKVTADRSTSCIMRNEKLLLLSLKLYKQSLSTTLYSTVGLGGVPFSCPLTGLETTVKGRQSRNQIEAKCISNFQVQPLVLYKTK